MDQQLFFTIHNLAGVSPVGDWLIVFFGKFFLYEILGLVAIAAGVAYYKGHKDKLMAYGVAVFAALVARFGVAELIRFFYHRPRPFLELNVPHLLNDSAYSFPSGHTIFLFALAGALYSVNKRLSISVGCLGLLIGLARVAGGVHYPSDILGGIVLGLLTGCVISYLYILYKKEPMP